MAQPQRTAVASSADCHVRLPSYAHPVNLWRAPTLWDAVGAELREYQQAGLAGPLTEDVVRFATARALVAAGADPAGLHVEWPHPALKGARVDLVAGDDPPAALLEFKFPREPSETTSPRTMLLGHVLKDLYRLAVYPGDVDRLFVYVQTAGLRAYMIGAAKKYDLDLDRDRVKLAATAGTPRAGRRRHPPLQPRLVPGTSRRAPGRRPHHRAGKIAGTQRPYSGHPRA